MSDAINFDQFVRLVANVSACVCPSVCPCVRPCMRACARACYIHPELPEVCVFFLVTIVLLPRCILPQQPFTTCPSHFPTLGHAARSLRSVYQCFSRSLTTMHWGPSCSQQCAAQKLMTHSMWCRSGLGGVWPMRIDRTWVLISSWGWRAWYAAPEVCYSRTVCYLSVNPTKLYIQVDWRV